MCRGLYPWYPCPSVCLSVLVVALLVFCVLLVCVSAVFLCAWLFAVFVVAVCFVCRPSVAGGRVPCTCAGAGEAAACAVVWHLLVG